MTLPMFIIDAFAERTLAGNPAAVCPLETWLPDDRMQAIAAEMNLSETVFFAPEPGGTLSGDGDLSIRWFTPTREVTLIGHATLAAGHLMFERLRPNAREVRFMSGGEAMIVRRDGAALMLEMPALRPHPIDAPPALAEGLGATPQRVMAAKHYLCLFEREEQVAALNPDMARIAALELPAVIVTAPAGNSALSAQGGSAADFVSRFFAPANGVPEDAVSGVAHLCLAPYWAERLGKKKLVGRQLSQRGGIVLCEDLGARVTLGGSAVIFLEGRIAV
ncbi:MAG: PhzF family phenazine biosynthesis protein [Rhodospirillaceae bacterium]|nr:PhzF family phenazine biosynthesis protein [Rhodospirillaceae bacterium]